MRTDRGSIRLVDSLREWSERKGVCGCARMKSDVGQKSPPNDNDNDRRRQRHDTDTTRHDRRRERYDRPRQRPTETHKNYGKTDRGMRAAKMRVSEGSNSDVMVRG